MTDKERALKFIDGFVDRIKSGEMEILYIELELETMRITDGLILHGIRHTGYETLSIAIRPKKIK